MPALLSDSQLAGSLARASSALNETQSAFVGHADFYDADLYAIQLQLEKMESSNILVSRKVGRTRVYQINPRYAFLEELRSLLEKALSYYPEEIREALIMNRRRPRRSDKPL